MVIIAVLFAALILDSHGKEYECSPRTIPDEIEVARVGHWGGTKPIHYDINIVVDDDQSFTISTTILIEVVQDTNVVFVHLDNNYLTDGFDPMLVDHSEQIFPIKLDRQGDLIIITSMQKLFAKRRYHLKLYGYKGKPQSELNGIYRSEGRGINGTTSWLWATLFQMRMTRKVLPCYDFPGLKAKFTLCVTHSKNTQVMSNTVPTKKLYLHSHSPRIETCFKTTPLISPYLFTFAIGENNNYYEEKIELNDSTLPLQILCTGKTSPCDRFFKTIGRVAGEVISMFQKYTKVAYPMPKYGYVLANNFFNGAIENMGLVASSIRYGQHVHIIAHETIHHWLGNLVTNKDWRYVCLQEGFTSYFSNIYDWNWRSSVKIQDETLAVIDLSIDDLVQWSWAKLKKMRIVYYLNAENADENNFALKRKYLAGHVNQRAASIVDFIRPMNSLNDIIGTCYQRGQMKFSALTDFIGYQNLVKFTESLLRNCAYRACNLEEWVFAMRSIDDPIALKGSLVLESNIKSTGAVVIKAQLVNQSRLILIRNIYNEKEGGFENYVTPIMYFDAAGNQFKDIMSANYKIIDLDWKLDITNKDNFQNGWFDLYNIERDPETKRLQGRFWGYITYPMEVYYNVIKCFVDNNICEGMDEERLERIFLSAIKRNLILDQDLPTDAYSGIYNWNEIGLLINKANISNYRLWRDLKNHFPAVLN